MKKVFLSLIALALFLTNPNNLFSQQKLTDFQVKIPRPNEAYICSDSQGFIASIFQSNKQYEIDFLDKDFKVIQTSIAPKIAVDKNQEIIGAVLSKDACTAYFYNSKLNAISLLSADRSGGTASFARVKVLNKEEGFLQAFEMEGKFFVLTVTKNSSKLNVMALQGKEREDMIFDMSMPGFYATLAKQNEGLNTKARSDVGIEEIKYDLENNIKSSYPSKKLYHFDGKIFMTFDEPGLTHLITVDVIEKTAGYKKLNFDLERGNAYKQKQGNSFLYKNRLFRTTISNEQLNISILDLDSMTLINSYNFYPNQEINILNGPMMQEGGGATYYTTEEKILKRSDQYFKKVLDGNLAIAANKIDSNQYELQVGSYEIYNTSRNGYNNGPQLSIGMGMGMGVGMGMGGLGYPYGGYSGYPGSFGSYNGFPGYYPNQSSTRQRLVYFKTLMGNENFEHLPGGVPKNMKDKINEYEFHVFKNNVPEVLMISSYKNQSLLLGYYVKGRKKFNIVEFKN